LLAYESNKLSAAEARAEALQTDLRRAYQERDGEQAIRRAVAEFLLRGPDEAGEQEYMREPDLTIYKQTDVWILAPDEEPPPGAAVQETAAGVRVAFRPVKVKLEAYDGTGSYTDSREWPVQ
jgi:hypothetical protein